MTLKTLEEELKKLPAMPLWGKKQSDDWDRLSNFVYELPTYAQMREKLAKLNKGEAFENYVVHRWYNTLSAKGVESIFRALPHVQGNLNPYDKLVDFSIRGIQFDHKTSVFPKNFGGSFEAARKNPIPLLMWLYAQQSKEQRFHLSNRLFIILYAQNGQHWRLRAELGKMQTVIGAYVENFDPHKLYNLDLGNPQKTQADIIWFCE